MTKFLTYYNLCPIPEPKDFLGISPDKEEGNIITTLGKNIIIIIKISTQKQIKSWSVVEKLSCKVVYDRKTGKYVGVFANKFIRCWYENTTDVNKCKKLKFHKSIAELVYDKNEIWVLYSDGSCELLSAAIESRKTGNGSQNLLPSELVSNLVFTNPGVQYFANGNRILSYFERNTTTGDHYFVRISLGSDENTTKRFHLKRGELNIYVAGGAVIEGDGVPVLLTIWSDKRIFLLNLADDVKPERSPGNFVSLLTQLKVDTPLSILGISKHFVAIYGANHGQEGASLLLYNTQYKVIKTKQFFKVYFNFSQLWSIDEHILLAMGQNLSVVKYRVLKEVLSDLVGTQVGQDQQSALEDVYINEEDYLEECLQHSNVLELTAPPKIHKPKYTFEEADGVSAAFLNTKEFDEELNSLKRLNLHVEVLPAEETNVEAQVVLMTNFNDNGFTSPEIQVIVRQLEKAGSSEHEITEKLLTVLMKANLLPDIGNCLRRYNNISEKILSKSLSYLLKNLKLNDGDNDGIKNDAKALANGRITQQMEVDFQLENDNNARPYPILDLLARKTRRNNAVTDEIKYVLNILLSCSFDTETIALHIRKDIEYQEIKLLMQYLYNMLAQPQQLPIEERPALEHCSTDYELQLFRWFGVCLNSHFQKLALARDLELVELLGQWHKLFLSYKQELEGLTELAALLYNIVERKKTFKKKNYSQWYAIEEVFLF